MFKSREHLIQALSRAPLRRSIIRALDDPLAEVVNLGGFYHIPPGDHPGFIVAVTSRHKKTWYVAAVMRGMTSVIRVIPDVQWQWWAGSESNNPLYTGDYADVFRALSKKAKTVCSEPTGSTPGRFVP